MAGNDKLFVAKNGLRTQNTEYLSPDRTNTITLEMLDSDTLSWEGDSGQLFSITDSLTGTIFSVNDISGIPSIEVDDDGTIRFAEFAGNVLVGTNTDDGTNKLQVSGSVTATSFSGDLNYSDITNPPTIGDGTITINAGGGLSTGGSFTTNQTGSETITIDHANTSSQGDVNNSGSTVVQDIFVDTYGHITSIGSKTLTAADVGALSTTGKAADADLLDGNDSPFYLDYNNFTNTPTIGDGTLTVSGGSGLTGSGTFDANATTNNSITLDHADTSTQGSVNNSGRTYIQDVTLDGFGHVTGLVSATETVTDTNDFVTAASFNTSTGVLTLTRTDSGTVTEDLDGRYLLQGAKAADADLLDGLNGTYYLDYNNFTNKPSLYNSSDFDSDFSSKTTDNLSEGSNNLYYTNARVDARIGNGTLTVSGASGLTGSGTFSANQSTNQTIDISHADTSSQGSVNNSGSTVIQDVTLDGFGHVTNLNSKNLSASDVGALGVNDKADDSDLLDGLNSSQFLRSDTSDTFTGSVFTILNQLDIGSQNSNTGRIKSLTDDAGSPGFELSDNFGDLVWAVGADDRGGDNQGDNAFVIKYNNGSSFGSSWTSNGSEYFTIDALGNIGIGSPSPSSKLDVNGSISATSFSGSLNYSDITNTPTIGNAQVSVSGGNALTGSGSFNLNDTSNSSITIDHADTSTQGSVNNSGNTYIQDITLDGYGHVTGLTSATVSGFAEENTAVTFTTVTATDFNSTSDVRAKENIVTLNHSLDKVMDLRGVSFRFKGSDDESIGVIAQEVEEIVPEVVNTGSDNYKSVSYGNLVGLLIEAVKEQQYQIDELRQQLLDK